MRSARTDRHRLQANSIRRTGQKVRPGRFPNAHRRRRGAELPGVRFYAPEVLHGHLRLCSYRPVSWGRSDYHRRWRRHGCDGLDQISGALLAHIVPQCHHVVDVRGVDVVFGESLNCILPRSSFSNSPFPSPPCCHCFEKAPISFILQHFLFV